MWKLLAGCLVLAFGIICVFIFTVFWIQTAISLMEPSKFVLVVENLMSWAIVVFGLWILLTKV